MVLSSALCSLTGCWLFSFMLKTAAHGFSLWLQDDLNIHHAKVKVRECVHDLESSKVVVLEFLKVLCSSCKMKVLERIRVYVSLSL
mgnify:CR=1 FL=1